MNFREEQQFRQAWLWAIVLPSMLLTIGLFTYGLLSQLAFRKPWGEEPLSDNALLLVGSGSILLAIGVVWLCYAMKLTTEVHADGIHLHYFPLARKTILFEQIESYQARQYQPLWEYGGWGLRWSVLGNGSAWNVKGNQGVQLQLKNGKSLMIGSQKAEELAEVIQSHHPPIPLQ